jgi:5-methylcytosine-specific restriction endonuclease McrA
MRHAGILRNFCYWNPAVYWQAKNPNVPDIPNKLIKLPVRKALTEQRKFWDIVINELGSAECIYTNKKLVVGDYVVEHFLPYAFVSHDLMWNLIPADRSFNSSKSDKLPPLDKYFQPYLIYSVRLWRSYCTKLLNISFWRII